MDQKWWEHRFMRRKGMMIGTCLATPSNTAGLRGFDLLKPARGRGMFLGD